MRRFTNLRIMLIRCCFAWAFFLPWASGLEIHVAPSGDDREVGTQEGPLASLMAARDRIREVRRTHMDSHDPVTVWIHQGDYYLEEALELTELDSGSEDGPVHWRAIPGATVRLIGGRKLQNLMPVTDSKILDRLQEPARTMVLVADLLQEGVADVGELQERGTMLDVVPASIEVFDSGRPLQLARFPNQGWLSLPHDQFAQGGGIPIDDYVRDRHWQETAEVWAHGFFQNNRSDEYRRAQPGNRVSKSEDKTRGQPHPSPSKAARCYFENILEELDQCGEWYLDRATGKLYVWPLVTEQGPTEIVVSELATPVYLYGASHVILEGLTVEFARVSAIEIAGGRHNTIRHCRFGNTGNVAVHLYHGQEHAIDACDIGDAGEGGIRVEGGDRQTLTASGHVISRCQIHDFNRSVLAGRAGIQLHGVGHQVRHNVICRGAGEAITLRGNDHLIEGNEIYEVCRDTDDVGAIYLGQDWTERGHQIRNNFIHDLGHSEHDCVVAIYLDDFASGVSISGNVFQRAGRGVLVGGGRDNVITHNLFVDGDAGVQIDSRGETWAASMVQDTESTLWKEWNAVVYPNSPYLERYPELTNLRTDHPARAKGNRVERNVFRSPISVDLHDGLTTDIVLLQRNWLRGDPQLVGLDEGRPQLAINSPALRLGCRMVPWESIRPTDSGRTKTEHVSRNAD